MATTAPVSLSNVYLSRVFRRFKDNLDRLFNNHSFLSEEDVRYALYLAFYKNIKMENIYLEFPYDRLVSNYYDIFRINNNGVVNELDALIFNDDPNYDECYLFEIKYHRKKNKTTSNKTKKAGDVLNDIERLHVIDGNGIFNEERIPGNVRIRKFFVYLTDSEMSDYFRDNAKKNKFLDFYSNKQKIINFDKFTKNCSDTFRDAARKSFNPNYSDPNDYVIREFDCADFISFNTGLKIYEILDDNNVNNASSNEEQEEAKVYVNNNKNVSPILEKLRKVKF